MSTGEHEPDSPVSTADETDETRRHGRGRTAKTKLDLDVQIADVGPCKKHLKVAIARSEIDAVQRVARRR